MREFSLYIPGGSVWQERTQLPSPSRHLNQSDQRPERFTERSQAQGAKRGHTVQSFNFLTLYFFGMQLCKHKPETVQQRTSPLPSLSWLLPLLLRKQSSCQEDRAKQHNIRFCLWWPVLWHICDQHKPEDRLYKYMCYGLGLILEIISKNHFQWIMYHFKSKTQKI